MRIEFIVSHLTSGEHITNWTEELILPWLHLWEYWLSEMSLFLINKAFQPPGLIHICYMQVANFTIVIEYASWDSKKLVLWLQIIYPTSIRNMDWEEKLYGLDWIGFTSGYRVSTALRIVYWPTPFLTRLTASRSGWLFQLTIPPKVTVAEKA